MEAKKGLCKNLFECEKADSKEVITVDENKPFVCPACSKNLEPVEEPGGGGLSAKTIGIIVAIVVLLGGGAAAAWLLSGGEKGPDNIRFFQSEIALNVGETKPAAVKITPSGMDDTPLAWSSDDEAIASVADGAVTGHAAGQTTIHVTTANNLKASVNINVAATDTEKPKEPTNTTTQPASPPSGTISVSGGSYTGELKNGKPHGMGTIKYSSRTLISKRDSKSRYAESGDYITGEFYNGELVQGQLYDKSNNQKEKLLLGRP